MNYIRDEKKLYDMTISNDITLQIYIHISINNIIVSYLDI